MGKAEMLAKVEAAYAARRSGNFGALQALVRDDAEFQIAGDQSLLTECPGTEGPIHRAAEELFDRVDIHDLSLVRAIAEEQAIAILWRARIGPKGGDAIDTMLFDLWEFDAAGRIEKGTQFVDTAKYREMMGV